MASLRFWFNLNVERFRHRVWRGSLLEKALRRRFYLRLLPTIRAVAREYGYAVGVHGSLTRDLDLVAAPWVDTANDPYVLAEKIREAVGGYLRWKTADEQATEKPHGRLAFVIVTGLWSGRYIDLSVIPRGVEE